MKLRRVQFGYCYIYGKISVEKSESQIVKEIFDKYIHGNSLLKIADSLNKRHIEYAPDVIGWNKARLKRIIENECYIGKNNYPVLLQFRRRLTVILRSRFSSSLIRICRVMRFRDRLMLRLKKQVQENHL